MEEKPNAFLKEYVERFNCVPAVVFYMLEKLNTIRKKSFTYYENSEKKLAEYNTKIKRVPFNKRVYVDESGIHAFLQREYTRLPHGNSVRDVKRGLKFEWANVIGAFHNQKYFGIEYHRHTTYGAFLKDGLKRVFLKKYRGVIR
jgi:hypothetical protein